MAQATTGNGPAAPGLSPDALRVRAAQLGLFETPILHAQVQDAAAIDADLRRAILSRAAGHADGVNRSNIGGWHSDTDMLHWGGPAATRLADLAIRMARRASHFDGRDPATVEWTVRMWANLSPPGALNMSHAHPGILWAAVYYLDMGTDPGDGDPGGELYLEDPRFPVTMMRLPGFRMLGTDGQPQSNERRLPTRAGDLVLFPAWLRHGVRPHKGSRDRISIAMNIDVKG
ncbi:MULTISPECIES: TIGR02466 family protein [unclassified Sphingomonas]|uniref:TIGR02466 family protein n=1 Tax=unclassified Sphingomonas TaxID=196159 RepID=UPI0006FB91AE|nr:MULTISPECIES: TIGR02466 family protein [unclassified Sphingomonas]KQM28727.1 hypothetical protein ASE58_02335 [Sphingomonas sp. Leaf9]KQM45430.1 hypothetical protein ASE57_02330 [Sphingomonas sp. Leaf11]